MDNEPPPMLKSDEAWFLAQRMLDAVGDLRVRMSRAASTLYMAHLASKNGNVEKTERCIREAIELLGEDAEFLTEMEDKDEQ